MPSLSWSTTPHWRNYHHTQDRLQVETAALIPGPGPSEAIPALRKTAELLGAVLGHAAQKRAPVNVLGSAWSFSDITKGPGGLAQTTLAQHIWRVDPADLGAAAVHRDRMVLAHAGTTIHDLNAFLEPSLSLATSGAHDGQTVGGMLGTGVHGSALSYGGFQNHIRGVHIVTGPGESWWIERGPVPWLAAATARTLANHVVLEADLFEATLVHLGGLGVVNAVLLEAVPGFVVDLVRVKHPLTAAAIAQLQAGDYAGFAREVWPPSRETPYYIEVILDPFHPYAGYRGDAHDALVTLFYKREPNRVVARLAALPDVPHEPTHEPLNLLGRALAAQPEQDLLLPLPQAVAWLVAQEFKPEPAPGVAPRQLTWGGANGPHVRQKILGWEIELYNAAYAIERAHLSTTLKTMLDAFHTHGGGHQVFTLRFVTKAAGLMAFTRFDDTVVINMDGLRTLNSADAARCVALALEREGIPFSQHWGKQGVITSTRVMRDFGMPSDPRSRAGRWRAARYRLLSPEMRGVVCSDALSAWGLA
ncbi:FAD/FMN-containing dehydrogenase [Sphingomonas sp. BE270]|uniref:FAD-binding protein n=3 Tax=Pseudomonadota TaxID=1224 RepID=UPI001485B5F8|nr:MULTISPECIES: FAD-binding protein [unclassified Sphingomonas]MDR6849323.1 FAD/FMN-containing dehydrogenase [Sphingomonas sp. BE137]MDR7257425.1 FAD/FMN-containing dehydrogenase [Sphingomonas sp. BE270]